MSRDKQVKLERFMQKFKADDGSAIAQLYIEITELRGDLALLTQINSQHTKEMESLRGDFIALLKEFSSFREHVDTNYVRKESLQNVTRAAWIAITTVISLVVATLYNFINEKK